MRSLWRMLGVALPVALLAACSDQATAPEANTPAIAADFTNNPDAGPWIGRYEFGYWYTAWNNNPEATIRAYHTTFPLSWAGLPWDDAACGPTTTSSGFHVQEISHWDPDHMDPAARYIENGMADVWIVLVDRTKGGPCNTRPVIASGWGKIHYNDNDYFGVTGKDTWSYRAEGRLTTPTGEKVTYVGRNGCVVNRANWRCVTSIDVH